MSESAWEAMGGRPVRFLISVWPWRCLAYLVTSVPAGTALLGGAVLLGRVWSGANTGLGVAALWSGCLLVLCTLAGPISAVERRRLRLVGSALSAGRRQEPGDGRPGATGKNPPRSRVLGYVLLWATVLPIADVILVGFAFSAPVTCLLASGLWLFSDRPIVLVADLQVDDPFSALLFGTTGLALLPVAGYLVSVLALAQAGLARALLTTPAEEALSARLTELTRSRARLVDAYEAEQRRIERDLHDGAQVRLTAVLMRLGLARLDVHDDPDNALRSLDSAYENTQRALDDLRDLVRGIQPATLTDRGFAAAATEVARRCAIPVDVDIDLPCRPPRPVETAAYFCVSEALANIVKHAQARGVRLSARMEGQRLVVDVSDDGKGGADPERGTGLAGLADRLAVLDGTLRVDSPVGGPTVVQVEVPCA